MLYQLSYELASQPGGTRTHDPVFQKEPYIFAPSAKLEWYLRPRVTVEQRRRSSQLSYGSVS